MADRFRVLRPRLRGRTIGLFRLGGEVMSRQEIGCRQGVVRIRLERGGRAGSFRIGERLFGSRLPVRKGLRCPLRGEAVLSIPCAEFHERAKWERVSVRALEWK